MLISGKQHVMENRQGKHDKFYHLTYVQIGQRALVLQRWGKRPADNYSHRGVMPTLGQARSDGWQHFLAAAGRYDDILDSKRARGYEVRERRDLSEHEVEQIVQYAELLGLAEPRRRSSEEIADEMERSAVSVFDKLQDEVKAAAAWATTGKSDDLAQAIVARDQIGEKLAKMRTLVAEAESGHEILSMIVESQMLEEVS